MEQSPSWQADRFSASHYGTRRFITMFPATYFLSWNQLHAQNTDKIVQFSIVPTCYGTTLPSSGISHTQGLISRNQWRWQSSAVRCWREGRLHYCVCDFCALSWVSKRKLIDIHERSNLKEKHVFITARHCFLPWATSNQSIPACYSLKIPL